MEMKNTAQIDYLLFMQTRERHLRMNGYNGFVYSTVSNTKILNRNHLIGTFGAPMG